MLRCNAKTTCVWTFGLSKKTYTYKLIAGSNLTKCWDIKNSCVLKAVCLLINLSKIANQKAVKYFSFFRKQSADKLLTWFYQDTNWCTLVHRTKKSKMSKKLLGKAWVVSIFLHGMRLLEWLFLYLVRRWAGIFITLVQQFNPVILYARRFFRRCIIFVPFLFVFPIFI